LTEINLDGRVLIFTGIVVLLTGIAFGLAPAWQTTKIDLSQTLKEGGRTGPGTGSMRLRRGLVVAEIALAFVLLVGAGLLIHSFTRLLRVNLGFNPRNVLKLSVALQPTQYKDEQQKTAFMELALDRIKALPGVEVAAAANVTPMTGYAANLPFHIENRPPALPGGQPNAEYRAVSADYLRALGIRLLRGRGFTEHDVKQSPSVIINEALAERYWPGEDPLGRRILDVLKLILREAMRWVLFGASYGLVIALALSRFLANLLYGVKATDPMTFAGVALLLLLVALIACFLPAWRAAKVDPTVALRAE
jgi:putative ABC transport system permease protein